MAAVKLPMEKLPLSKGMTNLKDVQFITAGWRVEKSNNSASWQYRKRGNRNNGIYQPTIYIGRVTQITREQAEKNGKTKTSIK